MSDASVDLVTLTGRLRFFSKFNGEIPRSVCSEALDEIERLEAEREKLNDLLDDYRMTVIKLTKGGGYLG